MLSTHQWRESSWLCHIKATGGTTLTQDLVHVEGLSHTSECLGSQVLTLKIALDQAIGRFTDQQSYWAAANPSMRAAILGDFTQGQLFLTSWSSHFTDNHQPGMDTQTDSELDTFGLFQTRIEVSYRIEDPNPVRTALWASSSWAWG